MLALFLSVAQEAAGEKDAQGTSWVQETRADGPASLEAARAQWPHGTLGQGHGQLLLGQIRPLCPLVLGMATVTINVTVTFVKDSTVWEQMSGQEGETAEWNR